MFPNDILLFCTWIRSIFTLYKLEYYSRVLGLWGKKKETCPLFFLVFFKIALQKPMNLL